MNLTELIAVTGAIIGAISLGFAGAMFGTWFIIVGVLVGIPLVDATATRVTPPASSLRSECVRGHVSTFNI